MTRAEVKPGDRVVVFGGGPIGTLIALVSRHRGADVKVVEINPHRVEMLKRSGLDAVGPTDDVRAVVDGWTDGTGADIAFEVSGSPDAAALVTEVVRVWGTVSIIAIHSEPVPFHLYSLFARELRVHGSRLYTRAAWEEAIRLAASGAVQVGPLVTRVIGLDDLQQGMEEALGGGPVMKVLVDVGRVRAAGPRSREPARAFARPRLRSEREARCSPRTANPRPRYNSTVTPPGPRAPRGDRSQGRSPRPRQRLPHHPQRRAHRHRRAQRRREIDPGQPADRTSSGRWRGASGPQPVRVFGKDNWDVFELRSQIGIVSADLHNRFVSGNSEGRITAMTAVVSAFLASHGILRYRAVSDEMRTRAKAALDSAGVGHLARRTLDQMSSGEARRVMLARALVTSPQALVLDEPTTGLDLVARHDFLERVRETARAGTTLILITHHIEEIVPEISRIVLLREGRVVRQGAKSDVLTARSLSELFGMPVVIDEVDGYAYARPGSLRARG